MIRVTSSGSTSRTDEFLDAMLGDREFVRLEGLAAQGVAALKVATPKASGVTAESWTYEIVRSGGSVTIWWRNTNVIDGFPVALGLRYGHSTGTGGWVQGYDFMTPALKPIFDKIANAVWEEVRKA